MNQPEQGPEYLQLALRGTAATQIADLQSLMLDMQSARQCADAYMRWYDRTGPDADVVKPALWKACCISYRRIFAKGKGHLNPQTPRLKFKDGWTSALTPDQLAAHESVLDMADKHIAHRVSDLEQVVVAALLTPPPMPREVVGVGTMVVHWAGPEAELAQQLITVCDLLLASAKGESDRLCQGATNELRTRDVGPMYEQVAERERREQRNP